MHQFRIFPRFCTGIVNYFSTLWVLDKWFKSLPNLLEEGNKDANLCHSLSSVVKILEYPLSCSSKEKGFLDLFFSLREKQNFIERESLFF